MKQFNCGSTLEKIVPGNSQNTTACKSLCEKSTLQPEDLSPLPDIFSFEMEMVVWNQVKFFATSVLKLVWDVR